MPSSRSEIDSTSVETRPYTRRRICIDKLVLDECDLETRVYSFDELIARFKKYSLLDHDTAVSMVLFIRGVGKFNSAWVDKLNCRMY